MDVVWFLPRLLQRIVQPRLLDRYVMGELIGPLLFGWTLFIVLYVFSLSLYKLAQLVAAGASPMLVGEMLWLRVILSSVYCLPMAMLLAGLMAFGRLSGENELIAMQASGIRPLRVVWNAFLLGLLVSFAGLAINEYVLPPAGKRLHYVEELVKANMKGKVLEALADQKAFIIQEFDNKKLARVVIAKQYVEGVGETPAELRDVTYMQYDTEGADGQVNMIIQAKSAVWQGPDPEHPGKQSWQFNESTTQLLGRAAEGKRMVMDSATQWISLNKNVAQVKREMKKPDDMSYRELKRYIGELRRDRKLQRNTVSRKQIRELQVELERKLSVPFAAVVLALIGAPLGIRRQRSTAGVGIGLSLLIIIAYYIGMSFLGVLGQSGTLSPVEAAWGCNVAGLVVGIFLTWRSS
jgi:lipopolysaccharide export system permease protein